MKVVFKDMKTGEIKLVPENLDDIWHLHNIIEENDLIRMVTFRTDDQSKSDQKRAKKAEKKRMKLGVRVENISFHEFSDRLRIHGTIEEGPQDLGSYHTFNIVADNQDTVSIVKNQWKQHHIDRISEAVQQRMQPLLIFVSLDEDTATIAILRQSGIQHIADIGSKRTGKQYESKDSSQEYYGETLSVMQTCVTENSPIVVIGPGFTREHFIKYAKAKNPSLAASMETHATGHASMNGVHEAVKTGVVDQIMKGNRVCLETKYIEQVFEEIKKDGKVAYGKQAVQMALEKGAVERLLLTDIAIRKRNGEDLLLLAQQITSDFIIINTMHEAGKKFEGIGGVAALLRFKI